MSRIVAERSVDPLQILDEDGRLVGTDPVLSDDATLRLYRLMVMARAYDEKVLALTRQGRLHAVYQASGQEAQTAAALALRSSDWLFGAYREPGMWFARGMSVRVALSLWSGVAQDGWSVRELRCARIATTIGTHLPHGTGFAHGTRLLGRDEVTLVSFGDGATSEGDFHAALNFAAVWKAPAVFFVNNNQYAQHSPLSVQTAAESLAHKALAYGMEGVLVDGMDPLAVYVATSDAVARARSGEGPTLIDALMYRFAPHSSFDGPPRYRTREEEEEWKAKDPLARMRLYVQRRGLWAPELDDEIRRDMNSEIEDAMEYFATLELPARDYMPQSVHRRMPRRLADQIREEQRACGEQVSEFRSDELWDIASEAPPPEPRKEMTMVEALNSALRDGMELRPETVIIGEDVGLEGGVFRVTQGLQERFGRERVIDAPLCEQGIMGTAVGMAMAGVRPVVEIEFAGFVYTALDQLIGHVARMRWRTRGEISLPIVVRMPGGGGHHGVEFHSDAPEAMLVQAPGLVVVYPATAYDAKGLMAAALESEDPVVFFEPIALYHQRETDVPINHYTTPIGKAAVRVRGSDATVVSYGSAVRACLVAATELEETGVSVEVIDLRTLYPWDEAAVLESVERTGRLIIVHEAALTLGVGAEIAATVAERGMYTLNAPIVRVGHADVPWGPALLESYSLISTSRITSAVRRTLER